MGELVALETQNMASALKKNPEEDRVEFLGSPHPISDEQIEKGDLEDEGELLRALKLSKTVGPTSASDMNATGRAEETVSENLNGEYRKHQHDLLGDALQVHTNAKIQEESSTAENGGLVNNYNDDLITFETVHEQDACSSLEADKESRNGQLNTSVSEKHETEVRIEKTTVEVSAEKENIALGLSESNLSPPVDIVGDNSGGNEKILDQSTLNTDANEVEKTKIGGNTSNELYSTAPDTVLESSKGTTQTIDESSSLASTADGNEPIYRDKCISEMSAKTDEGQEPISVGEDVISEQVDKDGTSADNTRPKDGFTARQGGELFEMCRIKMFFVVLISQAIA